MTKENLVLVEPTNIVAKFEYGDFIVEVESDIDANISLIWMRHRLCRLKVAIGRFRDVCFCDCEVCIGIIEETILEDIDEKIDEYMQAYGSLRL